MSLIRFTILSALFFLWPTITSAQHPGFPDCSEEFLCLDYELILQRTLLYIDKEDGEAAFREYKALEACDKCPEHRDAIEAMSNDIIGIFKKKNSALERAKQQQQLILDKLTIEKANVARQRDRQQQLRKETERMAREASIDNYIRQAQDYLSDYEYEKAYWLTDFVYNYIDSSHYEVKKMLYRLYNQKFVDILFSDDDFFEEFPDQEDNSLQAVEWSTDNQWLAAGMYNSQLLIFDAQGELSAEFLLFDLDVPITDLSFNSTADLLAVSGGNGNIYFFERNETDNWLRTNSPLHNTQSIQTLQWSPTHKHLLAYGGDDKLIHLHFYADPDKDIVLPDLHEDWVRAIAWSPDGNRIVSGDDRGQLIIWSLDQEKALHIIAAHTDYIRTVDWHPDGHEIISGADDGMLIFWDTTGIPIDTNYFEEWIYQVAYSDSGDRIGVNIDQSLFCILKDDNQICEATSAALSFFDWRGEQNTLTLQEGERDFRLKIGTTENVGESFRIPNNTLELNASELLAASGSITSVAWSPDGNFLAYARDNELIVISEDSIKQLTLGYEAIKAISWHPGFSQLLSNTNLLATIDRNGQVRIWDAISLELLETQAFPGQLLSIAWSPDGQLLACGTDNGNILIFRWDGQFLKLIINTNVHNDYVRSIAWSPDGNYIATTSDDQTSVIYKPATDEIIDRLEGHSDWVRSVCWLSNTQLATAGDDQKTIIWTTDNHRDFFIKKELIEPFGYHVQVAYTGDDERGLLAISTASGKLVFWSLDRNEIIRDTIVDTEEEIMCISWHPTAGELAFTQYGVYPSSLNMYNKYQKNLAFDPLDKVPLHWQLDDINALKSQQSNSFFNKRLNIAASRFEDVQWSEDEKLLAFIAEADTDEASNIVTIYDLNKGEKLYLIKSEGDVNFIAFSPNGFYLVDASTAGLISIREAATGENPLTLVMDSPPLLDVCWSPDSRYIAFLDKTEQLTIWDQQQKVLTYKTDSPRGGFKIMFHPDESKNLLLLNSENVYLFDIEHPDSGFKTLTNTSINTGLHTNMQWADNNKRLLLSKTQSQVVSFVFKNQQLSDEKKQVFEGDLFASLSHRGHLLCNYNVMDTLKYEFKRDERQVVNIRNLRTLSPVSSINDTRNRLITDMTLSADDQYLATLGFRLNIYEGSYIKEAAVIDIWDIEEAKSKYELEVNNVQKIAFSPKGNYLTVYKKTGEVDFLPMNLPRIQQLLLKGDKDRYFRQLDNQSKDIKPIQDFIEQCGLDKGLFLNIEDNLRKITQREDFAVRKGWAQYLMEQAWLKPPSEASRYFTWASSLHQLSGTKKVKQTLADSLALSDLYYDQVLYYLRYGQNQQMNQYLQRAIRLAPQSTKIDVFNILLNWHQGQHEKAFKKMLGYLSKDDYRLIGQLKEEYLWWQRKEVELNDKVRFFRILSNDRQLERHLNRPIDFLASPTMPELLAEFDDESRKIYLTNYYWINKDHENLQQEQRSYLYYTQAVQFLEDNYDETNFTDEIIKHYTAYLYRLMMIEMSNKNMEKALALAQKALAASRLWIQRSPDNQEAMDIYLAVFSKLSFLELIQGVDARKVKGRLHTVLSKTTAVNTPWLVIQIGHCELVLGNKVKAYAWYNQILTNPLFVSEVEDGRDGIDFITSEIELILPYQVARVKDELNDLNEINFLMIDAKRATDELLNSTANVDYAAFYKQKNTTMQQWLDKSIHLSQSNLIADSTHQYIQYMAAQAKAKYAYNLLLLQAEGTLATQRTDTQNLLKQAIALNEEADWIKAVYALSSILQDNWQEAEKTLQAIRYFDKKFPLDKDQTIRAFLQTPPVEIEQHPAFIRHIKRLKLLIK